MTDVHDVATYILSKQGQMTAMKLQRLVYYSQAWSIVWDEKPLFGERIEAWANGPIVPGLYREHQGQFKVGWLHLGNPNYLTNDEKETIDVVLQYYGNKKTQWLSELARLEDPWRKARGNCPPGAVCNNEITLAAMAEYYSGLL